MILAIMFIYFIFIYFTHHCLLRNPYVSWNPIGLWCTS